MSCTWYQLFHKVPCLLWFHERRSWCWSRNHSTWDRTFPSFPFSMVFRKSLVSFRLTSRDLSINVDNIQIQHSSVQLDLFLLRLWTQRPSHLICLCCYCCCCWLAASLVPWTGADAARTYLSTRKKVVFIIQISFMNVKTDRSPLLWSTSLPAWASLKEYVNNNKLLPVLYKLMELHVSLCNCMQALGTACKLMEQHSSSWNCMQLHAT